MTCTSECWTAVKCPDCGGPLPPRGRSVPAEMHAMCCSEHKHDIANSRHLWDEHDSDRHYSDPEGWQLHLSTCKVCTQ